LIGPLVEGRDGPERGSPREPEAAAEEHLDGERCWEGPVRGLCQDEAEEHQQVVQMFSRGQLERGVAGGDCPR
jgi:hypothetical protein